MKRCLNCMEEFQDRLDRCPSCGYQETGDWKEEGILRPGRILQGRYILGTVRSEGDTDITYIGWDALFSRKVLIQEFFPKLIARRTPDLAAVPLLGQEAVFKEGVNRFYQGRRKMILLYKEPDIECFYSVFRDNGTAFATMQYSDAQRLSEYVEEQGALDADEALKFLYMAGNAVKKVHRIGLLHGNVSMDSFFVMPMTKALVLTGFAEPCHYCGDPDGLDYRAEGTYTDVYGLAMMFCEMVSGTPGLTQEAAGAVLGRMKARLSDRSRGAIESALGLGGEERTSSVDLFLKGVFSDGKTIELTREISSNAPRSAESAGLRKGEDRKRMILLGAAGAVALAALILAAVLLFRTFPKPPGEDASSDSAVTVETESGTESSAESGAESTEASSAAESTAASETRVETAAAETSEAAASTAESAEEPETGSGAVMTEAEKEETKAAGTEKAAETTKAAGTTKARETTKAAGTTKAAETTKAAGTTKAAETTRAAETTEARETTAAAVTESTQETGTVHAAEGTASSRPEDTHPETVEALPETEGNSGPGHVSPASGDGGSGTGGPGARPAEGSTADSPQSV